MPASPAEQGTEVTIVSSDKDLMQLVGPGVSMLDPMKNRMIGPDEVVEKFGVGPERVIDVQALAGDSTDNVPGVPGIGVKTAAQLITEYGDLEALLTRAGEIKQPKRRERLLENAELARISLQLVTLRQDVPLEEPPESFGVKEPDPEVLRPFLEENAFKSIIAQLGATIGGEESEAAAPESPADADYELVQTTEALSRWVAAATAEGTVAVDTETDSLDAMAATLVGVSLALKPGVACYIPLAHRAPEADAPGGLALETAEAPAQIPRGEALALLKPLLEDPAVLKVGQNIKYDALVFAQAGIQLAPVDDTMLMSYVVDAGLHGHGMDELARLHLDYDTIKFSEVAGSGKSKVTFDLVPLEKALDYAAEDADITLRLQQTLKPQLLAAQLVTVYETLERPLIPILTAMERRGIKVDRDTLRRQSNDFATRAKELEEEIHGLAGRSFTIGSPKQLGEILFDEMGLAGGKKGKSGAYATGAEILEDLVAQGHELPAKVLDWRQLTKLKSTYTDALQAQINPQTGAGPYLVLAGRGLDRTPFLQ